MALKIQTSRKLDKITYTEGAGTATFHVKRLNQEETQECIEQATVYSWDAPDEVSKKERFEKINQILFMKLRFIKAVQSWDLEDEKGQPLECNAENKGVVYADHPHIANHISKEMRKIEEAEAAQREKARKNS